MALLKPKKILVIGGGFGGIRAAVRLSKHKEFEVTLISANDTFAYYPQLYHAATGGVRSESALPLSEVLAGTRVTFMQDTITKLDPESQTVASLTTTYLYDELILALGSVTNYFGIKGLPEYSYDIKTIEGAERFKKHLHDELLDHKPDLNYVVVGGGPTGVELAAALVAYQHRIVRLHGITKPKYNIQLVEAAPRILPRSPEAISARVHRQLQSLGITVLTGAVVQGETAKTLQLQGKSIATRSVVWTAGMANNPFFKANAQLFKLAKNGKVEVDEYLQSHPHVYVIGDNAATQYSGMAQTAIYDADVVTLNLIRSFYDQPQLPYHPKAPISVIPAGEYWAAVQWGRLHLYGYIGYILRRLADLIAYADIETWPKALRVWFQDFRREDNCQICSPK
jgi:NADH:ubiquinone reductase (H+-translocating)